MSTNSFTRGFYHLRQADLWLRDGIREHRGNPMAYKVMPYINKIKWIFNDFITWPMMADIRDDVRRQLNEDKLDVDELTAVGLRVSPEQRELLIAIGLELEKGETFTIMNEPEITKPEIRKAA